MTRQELEVNPNNQRAKWYAHSVAVRRREEACATARVEGCSLRTGSSGASPVKGND